jgi:kynureninase
VITRESCLERDRVDPLAGLREQFALPDGVIYLDGNSLGALPRSVDARLRDAVTEDWGRDLVLSWNTAGWIEMPQVVGDKIARLVGAGPGELMVTDSTSINLYKVLTAALRLQVGATRRTTVLSERDNFPTDLYIAASVARSHGMDLRLVDGDDVEQSLDESVAAVMLTQVNYRTGRLHDMDAITSAAHRVGALVVWDLAHSAGVVPVDLIAADADFAIGCGYKYLNGGPGAPAFVWVHPRHAAVASQPLSGWMGHDDPFAFMTEYRPAAGTARFQCGTPPILSLVALECGVDTVLAADPVGGMHALRAKSVALTTLLIELVDQLDDEFALTVATPRDPGRRGSQVSILHPSHGYEVKEALIARGVIGDFRQPDIIRFGLPPLYTRFVDVYDAVQHVRGVLELGEWRDERHRVRARVT